MERYFDNHTDQYPIVLLPEKIIGAIINGIDRNIIIAKSGLIRPILKESTQPRLPQKKYRIIEDHERLDLNGGYLTIAIVIVFIAGALSLKSPSYLLWLLLVPLYSYLVGELKFINKVEVIEKEMSESQYQDLYSKYEEDLSQYNDNKIKYQLEYDRRIKEFDELLKNKEREIIRNTYLEYIRPNIIAQRVSIPNNRGRAEVRFLEVLLEHFQNMIYMDMAPSTKFGRNIFYPDFTIKCPQTNLHIDIEIDEPYANVDKLPIHYIGNSESKDKGRNEYFIEINWCVIRFSEKQILNKPFESAETLFNIYRSIVNMEKYYHCSVDIDPTWTYEEALIKAKKNERNNYK